MIPSLKNQDFMECQPRVLAHYSHVSSVGLFFPAGGMPPAKKVGCHPSIIQR